MALSKLDHAALLECLMLGERHPAIGRAQDGDDAGWRERAEWSCWVLQVQNLHLRPWQVAPCDVDLASTDERDAAACALLRRMLAMGMSRYDPNPSQALHFA
jgi:hypothetical protein